MPPLPKQKPKAASQGPKATRSVGFSSGKSPKLSPTLRPPRKLDSGDIAGFGVGLLLYVLVLRVIQDGPEGPAMWLRAKFLNQTPTEQERG